MVNKNSQKLSTNKNLTEDQDNEDFEELSEDEIKQVQDLDNIEPTSKETLEQLSEKQDRESVTTDSISQQTITIEVQKDDTTSKNYELTHHTYEPKDDNVVTSKDFEKNNKSKTTVENKQRKDSTTSTHTQQSLIDNPISDIKTLPSEEKSKGFKNIISRLFSSIGNLFSSLGTKIKAYFHKKQEDGKDNERQSPVNEDLSSNKEKDVKNVNLIHQTSVIEEVNIENISTAQKPEKTMQ